MDIYQWGGRSGRRGDIEITRVRRLTNHASVGRPSRPISAESRRRYLNKARLSQGLVEYHNVWSAMVCLVPGGGGGFGGGGGEAPVTRALTTIPTIGQPPRRATSPRALDLVPRAAAPTTSPISPSSSSLCQASQPDTVSAAARSLSAHHPSIIHCLKGPLFILRQFASNLDSVTGRVSSIDFELPNSNKIYKYFIFFQSSNFSSLHIKNQISFKSKNQNCRCASCCNFDPHCIGA